MSRISDNEVDNITIKSSFSNEILEGPVSETLVDPENLPPTSLKTQGDLQMLSRSHQEQVRFEAISQLETKFLPYHKLPPEILVKIFRYCLNVRPVVFPPKSSSNTMPWVVCRVCSRWRSIVLADQRLWTNVRIGSLKKNSQKKQVAVRELLARSGNLGLELAMNLDMDIMETVLKHCARVESLSLLLIPPSHRDFLANICSFKKLQILHLSYHRSTSLASVITPETETSTCISLPTTIQELSISESNFKAISFHTLGFELESPAWASLVYLTALPPVRIHPLDILVIFRQCNELLQCAILLEASLSENVVYPQPIIIPKLQSLTIFPGRWFALGWFLDSLILPSLAVMKIGDRWESAWPQDEILSMIARSQCRLKIFISGRNQLSPDDVIPLMYAMPDLTALSLDVYPPVSDEIFDMILEEDLVLLLEELYIEVQKSTGLLKFLKSRWSKGPDQGIYRGVIYLNREFSNDEEKILMEELKMTILERGKEITLIYK